MTYSDIADFFYKLENKSWPGTDIPVVMRRPLDVLPTVTKRGIFFKRGSELIATAFVLPSRASEVKIEGDHVNFYFGGTALKVPIYPGISDFIKNYMIVVKLATDADLLEEFSIF